MFIALLNYSGGVQSARQWRSDRGKRAVSLLLAKSSFLPHRAGVNPTSRLTGTAVLRRSFLYDWKTGSMCDQELVRCPVLVEGLLPLTAVLKLKLNYTVFVLGFPQLVLRPSCM